MYFLFPGDPPRTRASKAKRARTRLPDDLFPLVISYYFGGEPGRLVDKDWYYIYDSSDSDGPIDGWAGEGPPGDY